MQKAPLPLEFRSNGRGAFLRLRATGPKSFYRFLELLYLMIKNLFFILNLILQDDVLRLF